MKKLVTKATGSQAARLARAEKAKAEAIKKAAQNKLNNLQPHQKKAQLIRLHPAYAKQIVDIHGGTVHAILQMPKNQQLIAIKQAIKAEKAASLQGKTFGGLSNYHGSTMVSKKTTTTAQGSSMGKGTHYTGKQVSYESLTPQQKNVAQFLKMSGDEKGLREFYAKLAKSKGRRR